MIYKFKIVHPIFVMSNYMRWFPATPQKKVAWIKSTINLLKNITNV